MKLRRPFIYLWNSLKDRCPYCGLRLSATEMIASPSGKVFSLVMCRNSKCTVKPKVRHDGDIQSAVSMIMKTAKGGAE